jgi:hypothetical protein
MEFQRLPYGDSYWCVWLKPIQPSALAGLSGALPIHWPPRVLFVGLG